MAKVITKKEIPNPMGGSPIPAETVVEFTKDFAKELVERGEADFFPVMKIAQKPTPPEPKKG